MGPDAFLDPVLEVLDPALDAGFDEMPEAAFFALMRLRGTLPFELQYVAMSR